jgi:SAM-dependent methyltransferase
MKMKKNKQHWDKVGIKYSKSWIGKSKEHLSHKELEFINKFFSPKKVKNILDIGIGNGRILANYLQNVKNSAIYGIDISEKMVDICKKRFHNNPSSTKLVVCDFSKEKIPFKITFDFISAIRVLKYNKNWIEMIDKISQILSDDGIAVFCMPNKYSLNVFSFHKTPFYRSSKTELKNICKQHNLEILDIQSFTRIPDIFYSLSNNSLCAKCVIGMEIFFSKIFGKTFLGRMLFLAVKKK